MVSLATYLAYRQAGRELMSKLMKAYLSRDAMDRSAKLLGILRDGVLVFDSEEEMAVLADFAINDYQVRGRNAIALYAATKGPANEVERELLAGFGSAQTSLFRIVSSSAPDHTLVLRNLLSGRPNDDVRLADVNLSQTAVPGFLLFLRVVPLRDFNMTSGIMFAFPGHLEERLLAEYKRSARKAATLTKAQRRLVYFYEAHKAHGLRVRYEQTTPEPPG